VTRARRQQRSEDLDTLYDVVRGQLLRRTLTRSAWGDWWISDTLNDSQPNLLVTSVVVLSFCLFRTPTEPLREQINGALSYLNQELRGRGAPIGWPQSAAAIAALASLRQGTSDKAILRIFRQISESWMEDLTYPLIHFYDFIYVSSVSEEHYGRDYFIAPRGVFIGIAALNAQSDHWRYNLQAERSVTGFLKITQGRQGIYRPDPDRHISTLDQAWIAILYALATEVASPCTFKVKVMDWVTRPKPDTLIWSVLVPTVIFITFSACAWAFAPDGPIGKEYLSKFWAYLLSWSCVFVAGITGNYFAQRMGRKIFPGL
jgi:hypothetical protein